MLSLRANPIFNIVALNCLHSHACSYVNPLVPTDFEEECNPSTTNPTPDPQDLEQKNKRLTSAGNYTLM